MKYGDQLLQIAFQFEEAFSVWNFRYQLLNQEGFKAMITNCYKFKETYEADTRVFGKKYEKEKAQQEKLFQQFDPQAGFQPEHLERVVMDKVQK